MKPQPSLPRLYQLLALSGLSIIIVSIPSSIYLLFNGNKAFLVTSLVASLATLVTMGILTMLFIKRRASTEAVRPLTKRTQTSGQLASEQLQASNFMDALNAIIWEADPQTFSFLYVSAATERILGYPVSAWKQPNFWKNHVFEDDREKSIEFCVNTTKNLGSGIKQHDFE